MADIKSMFANMSSNGGGGDADVQVPAAKKPPKNQSIEKIYQKKSQLEHILLRPDTYIGSVEHTSELMWIYDPETEGMIQKQISYVPGLYKIFDEILVNAADNKQRDKNMNCIKIDLDAENNVISVWNNGKGIPVVMHKEEKMFVPTMIFGHLLTSSNYNDEEQKVTGGRNGYGAKLCNIFSTRFTVETASKEYKQVFKQTWGSNMSKTSDPKLNKFSGGDEYTKITFSPDLAKFKMDKLDADIIGLMSRRAFDVAASSKGVKVYLNGTKLTIKHFKDYIDLYIKGKEDDTGNPLKVVHEVANERWEVALTTSDRGFQQVSFVNSIATTKGGRHVDYISDMIVKQLLEVLKKKNKGGISIKPFQVKTHMWVFINCLIVNPTFDSQTKENMTLQTKNFGSKCTLTEKFIASAIKSGIIESILSWAKFKAQTELNKKGGKKQTKLKGIPKLEDANEAGSKNSYKCTLILTEGDSAKTLAVSGLGVIGRDFYGVFPLRGKLLNVREATHKQILENVETNNLIKILGLQYKVKYNTDEQMKSLRYGKVMIMTDQDQDGSHIKGLLINFIHFNWPELLKQNFLEEFITPIVKCTKRNEELSFYSLPEFEEWKSNTANCATYHVKYYKGLGTSTSKEAKEYFTNMERHRIRFKYAGQTDDDHILLAFSKKHIEQRKEWLTNFMMESKRRKEIGLPEKYLYEKNTRYVSYTDFVNLELVLFSNADNVRSIPCMVDGLKPGQRKVLFTCIKRNDKREVKVAQLAGSVAELSAYHHGEVSLCMTIVNLAQNYVGSNNINLLEPRGQFGTRLSGGKDSASPRYIFTKMSPLTRLIYHPHDDALLRHEYDDNVRIEPTWYIPIIPMVLVNGADGIGTGWMTKIPNYSPREIVRNLRALMDDEQPVPMIPYYKNFKGTIEDGGDSRYIISGEISIVGNDKLEITELPVGSWTQKYKEDVLEVLLHGSEKIPAVISDYKEYNTDTTVKFVVTLPQGQMASIEKQGFHKVFKLQSMMSTTSMCAFDELNCLRRMDTVMEILKEFYDLRLKMYNKRKEYLEGMLKSEAAKLSNQARFIMEKCSGKLVVENKKRKQIVDELIAKGYEADPVQTWKANRIDAEVEEEADEVEDEEVLLEQNKKKPLDAEAAFKKLGDVKKFDYLLGMSMWMLTDERKNELMRQRDQKLSELDILLKKNNRDLWREDLDVFMDTLDKIEAKEVQDEAGGLIKKEKKAAGGKKKLHTAETLPSPAGKRIAPVIGEDILKKIQVAAKARENKGKRKVKKENDPDEVKDEFDEMIQCKKTLKQKLGTPEDAIKKGKAKREAKAGKDGLTQTKLNFTKKSPSKANGKKTRNSDSDNTDGDSGSEVEFVSVKSPVAKERGTTRRAAVKPISYSQSEEDEESEVELYDNDSIKDTSINSQTTMEDSDSNSPPPKMETSEDMFDSLVGRTPEKKESDHKKADLPKRKRPAKSEDKPNKKKTKLDSDSDMSFNADSSSNESDSEKFAPIKSVRAKKPTKYTIDSDSD